MRVAAMRDISGVEAAGVALENLRVGIGKKLTDLIANDARKNRSEELRKRVIDISNELDKVRNHASLSGGLEYRLLQSQYYIQQFHHHAAALRIERVTGFQQYDEFVKRRLSAAFDAITITLERYKEARNEIDVLLQRAQAEVSIKLTRKAEVIIAIGALYYATDLVEKLVVKSLEKNLDWIRESFGWLGNEFAWLIENNHAENFLYFTIFGCFAIWFFNRYK
jgi:hypothetical protein